MQHFKFTAAAALALLCLSSSLTFAAVLNGERTISMVDDGPLLDHGGDEPGPLGGGRDHVNNKGVGAEFIVADGPILKLSPYSVRCEVVPEAFHDGHAGIWFWNTGSETIPAGSIITVKYSDGTVVKFEVLSDIKPGAAGGIKGPAGSAADGFSCKATVKVKLAPANPTLGH